MESKKFYNTGSFILILSFISFILMPFNPLLSMIGNTVAGMLLWRNKNFYKVLRVTMYIWLSLLIFTGFIVFTIPESDNSETKDDYHEVEMKIDESIKTKESTQQKESLNLDKNKFYNYAPEITGGYFVKEITLDGNNSYFEFYKSYEQFKKDKPESKLTKEFYLDYFGTGNYIEKIFTIEPVRLLREFPALESVSMKLTFNGNNYYINVSREEVNKYFGFNVDSLSTEDSSWSQFIQEYKYTDENRKAFYDKFVIVN